MKKKCLIFTTLFLISCTAMFAAPAPFESQVVKAFADSLYQEGFLSQAEGEYKRYLFQVEFTEAPKSEYQSSLLSLCNIYKAQNDKAGITWLKNGFFNFAEPPVKEKINLVQGSFLFKERNQEAFSLFVNSDTVSGQYSLFNPEFVNLITASDLLLKKDISGLSAFCSTLVPQYSEYETLAQLSADYKTKSPGLALFLSMIVPGSGKWYTGSFGTFFSSFLTIGSFVAGTVYTGIQTEWKSWQPYVFGVCGLVLYITDIYGSYQSAKRYNDALFRILCEETEKLYDVTY